MKKNTSVEFGTNNELEKLKLVVDLFGEQAECLIKQMEEVKNR